MKCDKWYAWLIIIIIQHKFTTYGNKYILSTALVKYKFYISHHVELQEHPWVHDIVLQKTNTSNVNLYSVFRSLPTICFHKCNMIAK